MSRSEELFGIAQRVMPGGVNSPVRNFGKVGGYPRFIERGEGARVYDVDGKAYIDYLGSWGPLILGHSHPEVVAALQRICAQGTSFGAPTELEIRLAEMITAAFPSIELVRMVNSGTEATMSAIRLARAHTGRNRILKFGACYHGHADAFLIEAGSGALTFGVPTSPGVPAQVAELTLSIPYNDEAALTAAIKAHHDDLAALIIEPVAGNMGVIPPQPGFLQKVRELTQAHGIVLIFDEVITGFRVAWGGAQERYGVEADLTCLGKIIGGGLPVGAYGGRREIMAKMAPVGPVYQAGTLAGNPLAMTAGYETLKRLKEPGVYEELERKAAKLTTGFADNAKTLQVPFWLNRVGSMMCGFFSDRPVIDAGTALAADTQTYAAFFHAMLDEGIYLAPSQFEAAFVSLVHSDEDLERTIEAHYNSLQKIAKRKDRCVSP